VYLNACQYNCVHLLVLLLYMLE